MYILYKISQVNIFKFLNVNDEYEFSFCQSIRKY